MARPKEFDPDEALARSVELFRRRGYAATSISALTEEMGIGRGSLFATFGTKDCIFLAALRRYQSEAFGQMVAALESAPSPAEGIRNFFESITQNLTPGNIYGCLMVNSTVERGPHDAEVADCLRESWQRLEDAFARAIERGQRLGQVDATKSPRALARFFITVMRGMAVGVKLEPDGETVSDIVETALDALA